MKLTKKQMQALENTDPLYWSSLSVLEDMAIKLKDLLALPVCTEAALHEFGIEAFDGLCYNVGELPEDLVELWSGWSGNPVYVIKCPASREKIVAEWYSERYSSSPPYSPAALAEGVYRYTSARNQNKYTGDYGRSRLAYARYVLACVEYRLEFLKNQK